MTNASSLKALAESNWPAQQLDYVDCCPVCGERDFDPIHRGVRDWVFGVAPGLWNYQLCRGCEAAYLNPRPDSDSIGRAYTSYYTHIDRSRAGLFSRWRARWKNERLSALFPYPIDPRLNLPQVLHGWVHRKAQKISVPFGWKELLERPPGQLLDLGCGSGATLDFARSQGWSVEGIELDTQAVTAARARGLVVHAGSYSLLGGFAGKYDAIICSHVLEHVHRPVELLQLVHQALKPGGRMILGTPNIASGVHREFGPFWRGLEAPRHLVLFKDDRLLELLARCGFQVDTRPSGLEETRRASRRLRKLYGQSGNPGSDSFFEWPARWGAGENDFIQLIAVRD